MVPQNFNLLESVQFRNGLFRPVDELIDLGNYMPPNDGSSISEGCAVRCMMSAGVGGCLGGFIGGFFHTLQPLDYDLIKGKSTMDQIKLGFRGIPASSFRMASGFSKVGMYYSATECVLERERGRHDIENAIYAGCVTGAGLSKHNGPSAMALGCIGFAAFSGIIETYMRS